MYMDGYSIDYLLDVYKCCSSSIFTIVKGLSQARRSEQVNSRLVALESLKESEKGWIAGILDGEGYLGISKTGVQFSPRLEVKSTTESMQLELHRLLGGKLNGPYARAQHNEKPLYGWRCGLIPDIVSTLETISPYMIVKHHIALNLLEFCRRRLTKLPIDYTDKVLIEKAYLFNKRGAIDRDR